MFLLQGGEWVQSLVRELRSCMPCSQKKKNFFFKEGNTQAEGRQEQPEAWSALTMTEMTRLGAPHTPESRPQAPLCPLSVTGGALAGLGRQSATSSFSGNAFSLSGLGVQSTSFLPRTTEAAAIFNKVPTKDQPPGPSSSPEQVTALSRATEGIRHPAHPRSSTEASSPPSLCPAPQTASQDGGHVSPGCARHPQGPWPRL